MSRPPTVTPSFVDFAKQGPTISQDMRCVAITTYFLEAMDTPSTHEDREMTTWTKKESKWIGVVISEV